ncbi:MAG: ParA family protein [Pseudomonadota bacterium]
MQILTVANQKGGVGKTTTTVALGGLAAAQGQRVLLIDLDPHGSLTSYFGQNPDEISHSVFELFQSPPAISIETIAQLLLPVNHDNIVLLPASTALATLERRVIGRDGMGLVIGKALKFLEDDFDLVIIDSPPVIGVLLINGLAACDRLIVPVQTEFLALKGLDRMLHTLRMLEHSQKRPMEYVIVPTMYDKRTQASLGSLREIRHRYGENTWPGKIPVDTQFRNASKQGVPPHCYAPNSNGVSAYKSLLKWLLTAEKSENALRFWETG